MDSHKLKETIRKEIEVLTDFFSDFDELQENIIKKTESSKINASLLNIEKKSSLFKEIDEERDLLLTDLCKKVNIEKNIRNVIDYFSKNDKELALLLAKFVEKTNEFTLKLDMLRQIIGFQTNFDNLIIKLINIDKTGKTTYGKTGYNKPIEPNSKGWRG